MLGIADRLPQDLVTAADADNGASLARSGGDGGRQSAVPEPLEISDRALASGKDDRVSGSEFHGRADEANANAGLTRERFEVIGDGDPRQTRYGGVHDDRTGCGRRGVEIERILCG